MTWVGSRAALSNSNLSNTKKIFLFFFIPITSEHNINQSNHTFSFKVYLNIQTLILSICGDYKIVS
jgi:hypothetical protein